MDTLSTKSATRVPSKSSGGVEAKVSDDGDSENGDGDGDDDLISTVFVGNPLPVVPAKWLHSKFRKFRTVKEVFFPRVFDCRRGFRFAFVRFFGSSSALDSIAVLHGCYVGGRKSIVRLANRRNPKCRGGVVRRRDGIASGDDGGFYSGLRSGNGSMGLASVDFKSSDLEKCVRVGFPSASGVVTHPSDGVCSRLSYAQVLSDCKVILEEGRFIRRLLGLQVDDPLASAICSRPLVDVDVGSVGSGVWLFDVNGVVSHVCSGFGSSSKSVPCVQHMEDLIVTDICGDLGNVLGGSNADYYCEDADNCRFNVLSSLHVGDASMGLESPSQLGSAPMVVVGVNATCSSSPAVGQVFCSEEGMEVSTISKDTVGVSHRVGLSEFELSGESVVVSPVEVISREPDCQGLSVVASPCVSCQGILEVPISVGISKSDFIIESKKVIRGFILSFLREISESS